MKKWDFSKLNLAKLVLVRKTSLIAALVCIVGHTLILMFTKNNIRILDFLCWVFLSVNFTLILIENKVSLAKNESSKKSGFYVIMLFMLVLCLVEVIDSGMKLLMH